MRHIKDLLQKRIKQIGLAKDVETALIIKEFEKLVKELLGPNIIKKIKPLYMKEKILTVVCLNSIIIQEVNFRKEDLIRKINEEFKEKVIKDIKFTI